jgi:hypothetical protein
VKRTLTLASIIFYCAAGAGAGSEITAYEARYKALYQLATKFNDYYGRGYIEQISAPRVYYSYNGARKYYVFFTYCGPKEIPTWEQLEEMVAEYLAERQKGVTKKADPFYGFNNFIIPASEDDTTYSCHPYGPPLTIYAREAADRVVKRKFPDSPLKYKRSFIEYLNVYFEYRAPGVVVVANARDAFVPDADFGRTLTAEEQVKRYKDLEKEKAIPWWSNGP